MFILAVTPWLHSWLTPSGSLEESLAGHPKSAPLLDYFCNAKFTNVY
jgi:hypothetical protein